MHHILKISLHHHVRISPKLSPVSLGLSPSRRGRHITCPTMASARESAPNSQSSSFDDSQGSQYRPVSSGSFSSSQIRLPRETTPATSLSNPSSQEHMAEREQRTHGAPHSPRVPTKLDTRFGQAPVANMGRPHQEHTSAPKRSADGQIKEPTPTSPTSPGYTGRYEHSRHSSTTSRGSQVGEVCLNMLRIAYIS